TRKAASAPGGWCRGSTTSWRRARGRAPSSAACPSSRARIMTWMMSNCEVNEGAPRRGDLPRSPAPQTELSFPPMSTPANDWDLKGAWAPYEPDTKAPWDLRRVVHLHRRAGFAATWKELQRDLKDGPGKSIDRLLKGQARAEVPDNFGTVAGRLAGRAGDP